MALKQTAIRETFAKRDLAMAKKHRFLVIGPTTEGTLTLRYLNGKYSLTTDDGAQLADGELTTVLPTLADLYLFVLTRMKAPRVRKKVA